MSHSLTGDRPMRHSLTGDRDWDCFLRNSRRILNYCTFDLLIQPATPAPLRLLQCMHVGCCRDPTNTHTHARAPAP